MIRQQFAVVVPVKPPAFGKSRLVGPPDDQRRALATAFALDTLVACLGSAYVSAVLAVTDDATFAARVVELGCDAIPDGVTTDLNGSLRQAAAEARRRWPDLVVVAMCADLPALRTADLDEALAVAGARIELGEASFVSDTSGIGTTLYCAPHDAFTPRFGVDSHRAHVESGAAAIPGDLASLRRDVDDLADLQEALHLGLGQHTAALVTEPETH